MAGDPDRVLGVGAFLAIMTVFPISVHAVFMSWDCTWHSKGHITFDADPSISCPNRILYWGIGLFFLYNSCWIVVLKDAYVQKVMVQVEISFPGLGEWTIATPDGRTMMINFFEEGLIRGCRIND